MDSMINTIAEVIKELLQMTFLLFILGIVAKLFLSHTLLGKIIAVTIKDLYSIFKGCLKITRNTGKLVRNAIKTSIKYIKSVKNRKNKRRKSTKQLQKKVVNGNNLNNVIDFQSAKKLRHKWYK